MSNDEWTLREEADHDFSALTGPLGVELPSVYLRPDCRSAGISLDDMSVIAARQEALSKGGQRSGSAASDGAPILRAAYVLDRLRRGLGLPLADARFEPGTQYIHLSLADLRSITIRLEALRDGNPLADGHL